jgi:hypothetical protein
MWSSSWPRASSSGLTGVFDPYAAGTVKFYYPGLGKRFLENNVDNCMQYMVFIDKAAIPPKTALIKGAKGGES